MRTEALLAAVLLTVAACVPQRLPAAEPEGAAKFGADWESWRADTNVSDLASVQRGARNFTSYCLGCHSLKYERWSRLGADLRIPAQLLEQNLVPPGARPTDYIQTAMPAADADAWFGKTPPDLSLMVRARGKDYIYQFLTTFYVDPTRQTGANNLALPTTAMPDVLSELDGLKGAVFRGEVFDHFEPLAPGRMSLAEYDGFVRDTVNFLLLFSWLALLVKREYWKDVH
jgi:ubiquinol-cytochrome c reductase cytochrome c1 subunit